MPQFRFEQNHEQSFLDRSAENGFRLSAIQLLRGSVGSLEIRKGPVTLTSKIFLRPSPPQNVGTEKY